MTTLKSPILKKHLSKYGFDQNFLDTFELATDEKLQHLDELVEELRCIHDTGSKILVYTDFDVDGIMSGVIGYAGLSELGFNCELYKPLPADGYGMHMADIDRVMQLHPDCKIILTADVGIANNAAIEYAKRNGIRVLVTDHHMGKVPCIADIAVDPSACGETYPHKGICGAHVLWMVLDAYVKKYEGPVKIGDIWRLRLFAGIATVSDMMPLLYENRQLVRDAVSIARYYFTYDITTMGITPPVYSHQYSMCFAGIVQLLRHFESEKKIRKTEDITEEFFGFYLIPMLNACKRMDGDMGALYDVFFGQCVNAEPDYPDMPCVDNAIQYVYNLNNARKMLVDEKFREIMDAREHMNDTPTDNLMNFLTGNADTMAKSDIVRYADCNVYITDIPGGICGLLATKIMSVTGMPCLVLYPNPDGGYNGSGRSPLWFPFVDKMEESRAAAIQDGTGCKPIIQADGHNPAFGVRIYSDADLEKYRQYYMTEILKAKEEARELEFDPYITLSLVDEYEGDFYYSEPLIQEFMSEAELLHPYGQAFPAVQFRMVIPSDFYGEAFGSLNNHVKLVTADGTEFIWFNALVDFEHLIQSNKERKPYLATGKFQLNSFSGVVDFIINDMEVLGGGAS